MKKIQMDGLLLGLSVLSFLTMSVSFLLMPVEKMKLFPGLLFWGGLVAGTALLIVLEQRRRTFFRVHGGNRSKFQKSRIGLLSIRSNREATIADCALLASVAATILAFVLTKGTGYICYVCVAAAAFFLCLRCILNGRLYFHIQNREKTLETLEQMKVSKKRKRRGRE